MRKFEIRYFRYERHDTVPAVVYRKKADYLVDAFKKLPLEIQQDVLQFWDSEDPLASLLAEIADRFDDETSLDGMLEVYLNEIDDGGDSFLHVLEKTDSGLVHVCGIDGTYQEEGADQEW